MLFSLSAEGSVVRRDGVGSFGGGGGDDLSQLRMDGWMDGWIDEWTDGWTDDEFFRFFIRKRQVKAIR